MPDTYGAIIADGAIEGCPGREMRGVPVTGVVVQMLEGLPILQGGHAAPVEEDLGAEETVFRMGVQLFQHRRHRGDDLPPFPNGQDAVDAHPNEEDNVGTFGLCGGAARIDARLHHMILRHQM